MKDRHIGQVSFNLLDEYEIGLLKHATKIENGKFSKYIKRLIERDREGKKVTHIANPQALIIEEEEDVRAAGGFL
ncbi:hypothetical protein [Psychrobacillus sp. FJAT-21963]|uniref:hypothetical protein n=1 Tax=Psychrobacillus sp. FJAT-21963 TaxID=1712028 RepID=UPI0006F5346D|nr:hypothetical protein [Psychrobacillus sp. FJAT-21963]KQL37102.1 hypothetical protein AN959_03400 [Psychrobacillus sp. FJAT-21963]